MSINNMDTKYNFAGGTKALNLIYKITSTQYKLKIEKPNKVTDWKYVYKLKVFYALNLGQFVKCTFY